MLEKTEAGFFFQIMEKYISIVLPCESTCKKFTRIISVIKGKTKKKKIEKKTKVFLFYSETGKKNLSRFSYKTETRRWKSELAFYVVGKSFFLKRNSGPSSAEN